MQAQKILSRFSVLFVLFEYGLVLYMVIHRSYLVFESNQPDIRKRNVCYFTYTASTSYLAKLCLQYVAVLGPVVRRLNSEHIITESQVDIFTDDYSYVYKT